MAAGYIYVLVNSSMPGLVKVGKTTRDPAQRADELSGVTGVATPFILAFEQHFPDCSAAEEHVHSVLERRGYREARNREFFRAPASEIIRVIVEAHLTLGKQTDVGARAATSYDQDDADLLPSYVADGELSVDGIRLSVPWASVLQKANDLFLGTDDNFEDHAEALVYYKDAARLGSIFAYEQIGIIYADTFEDPTRAAQYFKEGFRRGNYYCIIGMARIFLSTNQIDNARKCWKKFFESRNSAVIDEVENFPQKFVATCRSYVLQCVSNGIPLEFSFYFSRHAQEIVESLERSRADESFSDHFRALCFRAADVVRRELLPLQSRSSTELSAPQDIPRLSPPPKRSWFARR